MSTQSTPKTNDVISSENKDVTNTVKKETRSDLQPQKLQDLEKTLKELRLQESSIKERQAKITLIVSSRTPPEATPSENKELEKLIESLQDILKTQQKIMNMPIGKTYLLLKACDEMGTSEINFHKQLSKQLELTQALVISKGKTLESYGNIKPYEAISNMKNPFEGLNISESFYSGDYNGAITNICSSLLKHLQQSNVQKDYEQATIQQGTLTSSLEKDGILLGKDDPTILAPQRIMRYASLLETIEKSAHKLNDIQPESVSIETMDLVSAVFKQTKKIINSIDEARGKAELKEWRDASQKVFAEMFKNDDKIKPILTGADVIRKKLLDPKSQTKATNEIATTIKTGQAANIQKTLTKWGFNLDIKTAEKIKQDYYYSQMNPIIREKIRQEMGKTNIHAKVDFITKIITKLTKQEKSSTSAIISKINQAFDEKNSADIEKYLMMLGADVKQAQAAKASIQTMMPTSSEPSIPTKQEPKDTIQEATLEEITPEEQFGIKSSIAKAALELQNFEKAFALPLTTHFSEATAIPHQYVLGSESAELDKAAEAIKKFTTNPISDLDISASFSSENTNKIKLAANFNSTISSLCDATLSYLVSNQTILETIAINRPDLIENISSSSQANDPSFILIRHFQKYPTLLKELQNGANKLNAQLRSQTNNKDILSEQTMYKVSSTLSTAEDITNKINTRLLFGPKSEYPGLVENLDRNNTFIKLEKPLSAIEAKQVAAEIVNVITKKQPKDIAKVLVKYGFTTTDIETAKNLKQGFYYDQIASPVREAIRDTAGPTPIHAADDSSLKIKATLDANRSTTLYLIDTLNKTFNNHKISGKEKEEEIKGCLEKLGLKQSQIEMAMLRIKQNMPAGPQIKSKEKLKEGQKEKQEEESNEITKKVAARPQTDTPIPTKTEIEERKPEITPSA